MFPGTTWGDQEALQGGEASKGEGVLALQPGEQEAGRPPVPLQRRAVQRPAEPRLQLEAVQEEDLRGDHRRAQ